MNFVNNNQISYMNNQNTTQIERYFPENAMNFQKENSPKSMVAEFIVASLYFFIVLYYLFQTWYLQREWFGVLTVIAGFLFQTFFLPLMLKSTPTSFDQRLWLVTCGIFYMAMLGAILFSSIKETSALVKRDSFQSTQSLSSEGDSEQLDLGHNYFKEVSLNTKVLVIVGTASISYFFLMALVLMFSQNVFVYLIFSLIANFSIYYVIFKKIDGFNWSTLSPSPIVFKLLLFLLAWFNFFLVRILIFLKKNEKKYEKESLVTNQYYPLSQIPLKSFPELLIT